MDIVIKYVHPVFVLGRYVAWPMSNYHRSPKFSQKAYPPEEEGSYAHILQNSCVLIDRTPTDYQAYNSG